MCISSSDSVQEGAGKSVLVLLVDDHETWREAIRSMLQGTEFEVVAEASTAQEALLAAHDSKPQLTLLDIQLPEGDGFEVLIAIKHEFPEMLVVMLTTYNTPTFLARAVAGGAVGYLLKGVTRNQLLETLRNVARGEKPLDSHKFLRSLNNAGEKAAGSDDLIVSLSRREEEVLRLLATGLSNRDIAQILCIAEGTVKSHVEHILNKLGVTDRVQAVVWAARNGLISDVNVP